MLAVLGAALLGLPSSKLGLLVAEVTGFRVMGGCAVGFGNPGLGETRGREDGGADVRLQPLTIPRIRAITPNSHIFLILCRSESLSCASLPNDGDSTASLVLFI
jgi:hypothetical protein